MVSFFWKFKKRTNVMLSKVFQFKIVIPVKEKGGRIKYMRVSYMTYLLYTNFFI